MYEVFWGFCVLRIVRSLARFVVKNKAGDHERQNKHVLSDKKEKALAF